MPALHDDELAIDDRLVARLVARSLPRHAGLRVRALPSSGSSNALYRLGDDLLVRLPRQPGGTTAIEKEARWLPVLAPGLSAAVPEVVAVGEPGFGYPERWAVTTWLEGRPPDVPRAPGHGSSRDVAHDLAGFVTSLHRSAVPTAADEDPALSGYRGGPLADLDDHFRASVDQCRSIEGLDLDLAGALDVWGEALAAESTSAPPRTWCHGDLLAENLLVRDGRLAAVLDFGSLAVGDPAADLMVAWEVLDRPGRRAFRQAVGAGDAAWAKGRGWALLVAMITFPYYWRTMPARCSARRSMAAAVLAEG